MRKPDLPLFNFHQQEVLAKGAVTGLYTAGAKSFHMQSQHVVRVSDKGLAGSRIAVAVRLHKGKAIFLSHRDVPELAVLDIIVDQPEKILIRPIWQSHYEEIQIKWGNVPYEINVFSSSAGGYDFGDQISSYLTNFINRERPENEWIDQVRLFGSTRYSGRRQISDKYLPTDVGVSRLLRWQDCMAYSLMSEEELLRVNQFLQTLGGNVTPMQHWRMNIAVTLPEVDIQRIKDVRIGRFLFRNVKPCERCQGMNTNPYIGKHYPIGRGPIDLLKVNGSPFRGENRLQGTGFEHQRFAKYVDRKAAVPIVGIYMALHLPQSGVAADIDGHLAIGNRVEVLSWW